MPIDPDDEQPIHTWFSLSYSNYYVMPRVLLEALPTELQREWVALQEKMEEVYDTWSPDFPDLTYEVHKRGPGGRFVRDPLSEYRRPDRNYIESLKRRAT